MQIRFGPFTLDLDTRQLIGIGSLLVTFHARGDDSTDTQVATR